MRRETTWVVVADGARARILEALGVGAGLRQIENGTMAGSRDLASEIGSDREGRSFDSLGGQRHAMQPHSDPREIEARRFVASIAADLLQARRDDRYQRLVIVAPPKAMGELRGLLPAAVAEVVAAELTEDLTRMPLKELESLLARREILPLRG